MTSHSHIDKESDGLGWRFWIGLTAVTLACAIGFVLALIVFGLAWYTWGFVGAAILLIAVAFGAQAIQDRRARRGWS